MKKLLLSIFIYSVVLFNLPSFANEIEEDYIDIAANYCVMGDYNSAMDYLDKVLAINPDNKKVADLKKGLAHIISHDKKTFITAVNPYIKQAQEYKRLGNDKMEYSELLNGTQSQNPYLAYYYLGNFFRERNDYLRALDAYNNALSSKPDFAQVYLASAITLYDAGRYESAINPIDKYLTFNSNDDLAYALKARIELQLGMNEQAKEDNLTALTLNNCPEYLFDKAKILYKTGNYAEAKEIFTGLLQDIQTSKIYEYIGYCELELGNYMGALNNIDRALILSNDDEYLENKYNEIKELLESSSNE